MPAHHRSIGFRPGLSLALLVALLGALWLAGGASRADVMGQVVVRGVAWGALIAVALFGDRPGFRDARTIWALLIAAIALPLAQLVPLPPGIWQALPGRSLFAEAAAVSGQAQPWRPLSIVPGATVNAASSLVVPIAMLVLLTGLEAEERRWLPALMLGIVVASMLVGLLQFSGAGFGNPLINDTPGEIAGTFANRNHFALFMAFGCLLAPVWAFLDGRQPGWRAPAALGLVLLFALAILASGSRAGLFLGLVALGLALAITRQAIRRALRRYPRWVFPAAIAGVVGVVVAMVVASVAADRAASITRVLAVDVGEDMRTRGLPTVLAMIGTYFPVGTGLGGFDPMFRLHEPFELLKLTYFNHAHNDMLEIVLDAGLPGLLLLLAAMAWWARVSLRAWRAGPDPRHALPKLGSAMLLLLLVASAFDYPARTPIMMAWAVAAALWLNGAPDRSGRSALPHEGQQL